MEKEADSRTGLLREEHAVLVHGDNRALGLVGDLSALGHVAGDAIAREALVARGDCELALGEIGAEAVGHLGARRGASSPDPARRVARDLVTDRAPRFRYTILARPLPSASSHRPPPSDRRVPNDHRLRPRTNIYATGGPTQCYHIKQFMRHPDII